MATIRLVAQLQLSTTFAIKTTVPDTETPNRYHNFTSDNEASNGPRAVKSINAVSRTHQIHSQQRSHMDDLKLLERHINK